MLRLAKCLPGTISNPPGIFKKDVMEHFRLRKARLLELLEGYLEVSEKTYEITGQSPDVEEKGEQDTSSQVITGKFLVVTAIKHKSICKKNLV